MTEGGSHRCKGTISVQGIRNYQAHSVNKLSRIQLLTEAQILKQTVLPNVKNRLEHLLLDAAPPIDVLEESIAKKKMQLAEIENTAIETLVVNCMKQYKDYSMQQELKLNNKEKEDLLTKLKLLHQWQPTSKQHLLLKHLSINELLTSLRERDNDRFTISEEQAREFVLNRIASLKKSIESEQSLLQQAINNENSLQY